MRKFSEKIKRNFRDKNGNSAKKAHKFSEKNTEFLETNAKFLRINLRKFSKKRLNFENTSHIFRKGFIPLN